MIKLLKFIVYLAGATVLAVIILNYFGYEINKNYFKESKKKCQENIGDCAKEYVEQGTKNAECEIECVNPKLIIKKKK